MWGTARNMEAMINILIENMESKDIERLITLSH